MNRGHIFCKICKFREKSINKIIYIVIIYNGTQSLSWKKREKPQQM